MVRLRNHRKLGNALPGWRLIQMSTWSMSPVGTGGWSKRRLTSTRYRPPVAAICDVGATLYHIHEGIWKPNPAWETEIGRQWKGYAHDDITRLLADVQPEKFYLQPPEKQNRFKISYFADISLDMGRLREEVAGVLDQKGIPANIICSVDTAENLLLIDILPAPRQ